MLPVNSAISIVDDDDSLRNSLNNLLRSLGFRADGFSSAEAFLTSSRLHETDCLILDVRDSRDERTESSASPRAGQFANPDRVHYVTCRRRGARASAPSRRGGIFVQAMPENRRCLRP